MLTFYCIADNTGPTASVDWHQLYEHANSLPENDVASAVSAVDTQRVSHPSHIVRNGNPPRTHEDAFVELTLVELGDSLDQYGGRLASVNMRQLRCPECLAPVRAIEV